MIDTKYMTGPIFPLLTLCLRTLSEIVCRNKSDLTACLSIRLKLTLAKKSTAP